MNHLDFAYRNVMRRPLRSLLTAIGVAVAVGSFITLIGLSHSIQHNAMQSLNERGAHLTISQRGSAELFGGALPLTLESRLLQVPGVTAVGGELLSLAATSKGPQILAAGWTETSFFWPPSSILEGRNPQAGERHVALVGDAIAAGLKKRVGDSIDLLGVQFRIVGIAKYSSLVNRNMVVVPLADLQEAAFRPGIVTFLHVRLAQPGDPDQVARAIRAIEAVANVTVSTNDSILRDDRMLEFMDAISSAMAIIALFMGILMVLNTLLMAVTERTREIGILSAIGWSSARIMGSLVLEGLLLSLAGGVIGAALGIAGARGLSAVPAIGRYLAVTPNATTMLITVAVAAALGALGSIYPAWAATRQDPAIALQKG